MVNTNKIAYFTFVKDKRQQQSFDEVTRFSVPIRQGSDWKYLGVVLSENVTPNANIVRMFRAVLTQFSYLIGVMLNFLFRTWFILRDGSVFKYLAVAYQKCVKKATGLSVWDSNHEAPENVSVPIFKHL